MIAAGAYAILPAVSVLSAALRDAEALLIVPPFARLDLPSIGVHLLQACAARQGHDVAVYYAGLSFARLIGEPLYHTLSELLTPDMLAERIFARPAHGLPRLGKNARRLKAVPIERNGYRIDRRVLKDIARHAEAFIPRLADAIVEKGYRIVGCTTVFEQTNASLALLKAVKQRAPQTITVLGGANCFGEMADGVASIAPWIDHVFEGESEQTFLQLFTDPRALPRRVQGRMWTEMDALPTPTYRDYLNQVRGEPTLPGEALQLPIETSRGCWWGQKRHCTFCGVAEMSYRYKSADRVIDELSVQLDSWPSRKVHTVDDIMPYRYFRTLLPRLPEVLPNLEMFYEQKANLTLKKVRILRNAGIQRIQPGLESLSTPLLQRMDKGTTGRQNLALLRYARATQLRLVWNFLYGFPGDTLDEYSNSAVLLPLIHHLNPPQFAIHILLVRFSPYHKNPARYGVTGLRPASTYADIFPDGAPLEQLAYYFDGEYTSAADTEPKGMQALLDKVADWRDAWTRRAPPELTVRKMGGGMFLLHDTRGLPNTEAIRPLTRRMAAAALVGRPLSNLGKLAKFRPMEQALFTCVEMDGWSVPLATADPELLQEMEDDYGLRGTAS
ncbi:MAG: RiPP maturation radical SAM C-methyltransferase [Myxococcota bacterium]